MREQKGTLEGKLGCHLRLFICEAREMYLLCTLGRFSWTVVQKKKRHNELIQRVSQNLTEWRQPNSVCRVTTWPDYHGS